MANVARQDIQNRKIEVNRENLILTLEKNKQQHIKDYEEAKAGYRAMLINKINNAFVDAKNLLERKHSELKKWAESLTDIELLTTNDRITLVHSICLDLKVPRSYEEEYDAAIDMAKWDVRTTLELTYAEFNCFVRDQWDWQSDFQVTNALYKHNPLSG